MRSVNDYQRTINFYENKKRISDDNFNECLQYLVKLKVM